MNPLHGIPDDKLDEAAELYREDRAARRYQAHYLAHPDCRDPDHPGCAGCESSRQRIVTEYVAPPVPTCQWDWIAYVKGDDEEGAMTGRGPTETEALRDLCEQLAEAREEA